MTTRSLHLPFPGPLLIAGGIRPARVATVVSTGTPPSGAPSLVHHQLRFDPTTQEFWAWRFIVPRDYFDGASLRIHWGSLSGGGNVKWRGGGTHIVNSDTDMDTAISGTVTTNGTSAVPTTVGQIKSATLPLSIDAALATQEAWAWVARVADEDTEDVDAFIVGAWIDYEDA